jgi:hypothetical protein
MVKEEVAGVVKLVEKCFLNYQAYGRRLTVGRRPVPCGSRPNAWSAAMV